MVKRSHAQRRAENIAKQEKLKRERAEHQGHAAQPPLPPVALAEAQKEIQAPEAKTATGEQRSDKSRNRPTATHADWAVAAFTAVLSVLAIVQGTAMVIQNNIMRDQMQQTDAIITQMKNEQRAWVCARDIDFDTKTGEINVVVENYGKSPATIEYSSFEFYTGKPDGMDAFAKKYFLETTNRNVVDSVMAPGSSDTYLCDEKVRKAILKEIVAKRTTLVFLAHFRYRDTCGAGRESGFCCFYDITKNTFYQTDQYNYMK